MPPERQRTPATLLVALLALVVMLFTGVSAQAATDKDRELKALRSRIAKINKEIARDTARRDTALADLGKLERQIQDASKNLVRIRADRDSAEQRLAGLRAQQVERQHALEQRKSGLAAQVKAAFMNGRQEQLKMLLSQEDPATVGRMTVYYRYLSERRVAQVRDVIAQLEKLQALATGVKEETANLARLETERTSEIAALKNVRGERAALVSKINARIDESGTTVSRLEEEEARLVELIRDLEKLLKDFPVDSQESFSTLRGKLAWPVPGRLLADFGQPRAGRKIKWNGVLVGASRGDPVRAIARGRVAFSDWLPGLGLLVVLEHSDGYISLYGHNDTLMREAGEWLKAGDTLATVGDSGGQSRAALYFEIRRGREPVNPHPWFRRPVSAK